MHPLSPPRARLRVEPLEPRDVPAVADLAVTITDNALEAMDATVARYQIVVTNNGPDAVANATISDATSSGSPLNNATFWTATASAGATVNQGSGFGLFSIGANLPVGGRVVILANVQVQKRTSGVLATTATVTPAAGDADPNSGNNTATDTTLIGPRSVPDAGVRLFATGTDAGVAGDVRAYDLFTGQLIYRFAPFGGFRGGVRVATGDVTGDGRDDIIVWAGPGAGPHVKVYDGRDLSEIASFFAFGGSFGGGVYVSAALLDVPATGALPASARSAIVVGAGPGAGPHVKAFDAATLAELMSFYAFDPAFQGGVRVGAGNLDGTLGDELIVGAGAGGPPHVRAFNRTGTAIASFFAYEQSFFGGVYVSGTPGEIVTGAGTGGQTRVRSFGSNGSMLREATAFLAFPGEVRVATADRNGDGIEDLILGAGPGGGPNVLTLAVPSFTVLGSFFPYDPSFSGGVFVG